MSLYLIATTSLTTPADRRRRPALDHGQLGRALGLCVIAFLALAVMAHYGRASLGAAAGPAAVELLGSR